MNVQKSIKILIVDNEPNILLSLEFLMRKEGFIVFVARDEAEAFDIIQNEHPKIVLLDTAMPKVDDHEVYKFIRSHNETKETKVVFLGVKSKESDNEKEQSVGIDLYFPKPFSARELLKKINIMISEVGT